MLAVSVGEKKMDEKKRLRNKLYYQRNKERLIEKAKQYYKAHREELLEKRKHLRIFGTWELFGGKHEQSQ